MSNWPPEVLEKQMLRDAKWVAEHYDHPFSTNLAADVECHLKACLSRIRELESEIEARDDRDWERSEMKHE